MSDPMQAFADDVLDDMFPPEPDEGEPAEVVTKPEIPPSFTPGGSFVLDAPDIPPAVWGSGGDILWAEGEACMIAAPQGCGKTTVGFQVVRGRLGLQDTVLGLPIVPGNKRVLYLAMDRPAQARRAAARLFAKDDRALLDDRLIVWPGPPPYDMAKHTSILAALCERADADTVVVDSIKDAAIGLSSDEVGAAYNRSRQFAIAAGVQVLELHHTVKRGANGSEPNTLADVYGSTWLTSGAGSVISLFGEAGDPIVSFRHLKQPMNEVGPHKLMHDHVAGTSEFLRGVDILDLVRAAGAEGLLPRKAAMSLFETMKPTDAQTEKARRKLERLREQGMLARIEAATKGSASAYYLAARVGV